MAQVFVLQNQHKGLLNKRGEWCDGRDARSLFNTLHQDEALNQKIEVNAKDYTLRITILECERSDKGVPLLKDEDLPPLGSCVTSAAVKTADENAESSTTDSDTTVIEPEVAETETVVVQATEDTSAEPSAASMPDALEVPVDEGDETAVAAKIAAMLAEQAQLLDSNKH